jgi:hypothetical protein
LGGRSGELDAVEREIQQLQARRSELQQEVARLEETLEDLSFGLYKPHFNFATSEEYKARLKATRDTERRLLRDGKAFTSWRGISVGGSLKEGERVVQQHAKVLLRAFNGECDAALANVTWNNVTKMEERIATSFAELNKLGKTLDVSIRNEYAHLKLDELRLAHEYEAERYQEREEQRLIREQIREEEKAARELRKAQEDAEKDEARYKTALDRARAEIANASGRDQDTLLARIETLSAQLESARQAKERAIARAQQTKAGTVYVISNLGSFGDGVFKIGLTRREDPLERVQELGDASVPFPFDVHALLNSEDAPQLEARLHQSLAHKRINAINQRREFFRATLEEIETAARAAGATVEFARTPEAREYRQSVVRATLGPSSLETSTE